MATYQSDKISAGVAKSLPLGYVQSTLGTVAVPTSTVLGDVYQMVKLSSDASLTSGDGNSTGGPTIIGVVLSCDNLDSSTGLTINVGDSGSATRFLSASTVGQGGGTVSSTTASAVGYKPFGSSFTTYTTPSLQTYIIQCAIAHAPTTGVAGNMRVLVNFTIDP